MKIKNLGTLHSVSSGKMDENGRSSYSHLKLTFRLLLCAWIIACSWNQRGALWRQSWLLSCSLWSLSFFSAWRCFLEKQRWTYKKQDLKPLIWHYVLKVEDWCLPTHILRRQDNLGKTYPTIESFRLVFEFLCLVCHHLIHMYPAELCKLSESKKPTERPRAMSSHPYIKFHVVTTQTPLQNEVVVYHSGNGTLQNCHCFVWLASQCHGR